MTGALFSLGREKAPVGRSGADKSQQFHLVQRREKGVSPEVEAAENIFQ